MLGYRQRQEKILAYEHTSHSFNIIYLFIYVYFWFHLTLELASNTRDLSTPSNLRRAGSQPLGRHVFILDEWEV